MMRYALFIAALLLLSTDASAQDTIRVVRDTARIAQDTARRPSVFADDSVRPIPQLANLNLGPANGFVDGVWTWNRESFHDEGAITLGDLLERLPGIVVFRTGLYLQPEAASVFGGTANRLEVWLDGYALDPMLEASFDLSKMELAHIESIRIERRIGRIRIHIQTLAHRDNRAYSRIEAAVGQPNGNLFRGLFAVPHFLAGPIAGAIDRLDTKGTQGREPANQTAGWLKWSYIRGNGSGLQLEYRQVISTRDPEVVWDERYTRKDLIARGRVQLKPGLVAEAFGGRTLAQRDTNRIPAADSLKRGKLDDEDVQFGGRLSFESPNVWGWGAARFRSAASLPSSQFDGAGGVRLGLLSGGLEATQTSWHNAGAALEFTVRVQAGPYRGARVFAETTSSTRGAPYLLGRPDSFAVITKQSGLRAGAEVAWKGITAGAALIKVKSDSVPTFGLPYDRSRTLYFGANATGSEVSGRIPLPLIKGLFAEGVLTDYRTGNVAVYLPSRTWRGGLELHAIPLPSGNLEILGRLEAIQRGPMLAPNPVKTDTEPLVTMPAITWVDAYLQIRIMDVSAFIRVEDFQGQQIAEIPNRILRGARMIYGIKWQFFN